MPNFAENDYLQALAQVVLPTEILDYFSITGIAQTVLKNRDVVLFPDLGATTVWQNKLPMMKVLGIRATLFDFLEHQACEEDKAKGLDIADYLLKIKPAEARLQVLIKQNPAIRKLLDVFKLEIVDEPKPRFRSPKRQRGFRL